MIIIKGGTLVTGRDWEGDLAIEGDKIKTIAPSVEAGPEDEVIDASGCYVFPGGIDPHTHFAMTNALTTTADDYASGSAAALAGGTTTVINFATPYAGEEQELHKALEREMAKAAEASCDYAFHIEVLEASDAVLAEIPELREQGHLSYKVYLAYSFKMDDPSIYRTVKAVRDVGGTVGAHCENGDLINALTAEIAAHHKLGPADHPHTRPPEIEAEAVNRFAMIGRLADYPVHVVHLSSCAGMDTIREHRLLGTKITAETCPQYLFLDESLYESPGFEGAKYVCSPPLRTENDRSALLQAIADGEIQTLATDHCSYTYAEQKMMGKEDYSRIPGGIPGVQFRLPLAYTNLLASGLISPEHFVHLTSTNAAKLYGLYPQKGVLAPGSDADIVIYKKAGTHQISRKEQLEAVDYTPYEGLNVEGSVRDVFLRGRQVVKDGEVILRGQGRYVKAGERQEIEDEFL